MDGIRKIPDRGYWRIDDIRKIPDRGYSGIDDVRNFPKPGCLCRDCPCLMVLFSIAALQAGLERLTALFLPFFEFFWPFMQLIDRCVNKSSIRQECRITSESGRIRFRQVCRLYIRCLLIDRLREQHTPTQCGSEYDGKEKGTFCGAGPLWLL